MKTFLCTALLFSAACGNALTGSWETTTVPAGTTSFSEYRQTLTIRADDSFSRDIKATYTQASSNPGCIVTLTLEGTWSEPAVGQLRFVAATQRNSTSTACSDPMQNYAEADKPASGAAAVPEVVEYKLSGDTLTLTVGGQPYISYKRK